MINLRLKYGTNNVPILSDKEIDSQAEALVRDFDPTLLTNPHAIDVEKFAEFYLGLGIDFARLSHSGFIWGCMVFNDTMIHVYDPETNSANLRPIDASTIVIDSGLLDDPKKENAFRSTVMHECGHAIYHKAYYYANTSQTLLWDDAEKPRLPYIICRGKNILGENTHQPRKFETDIDWIEHQAKYFSAAVLMPRSSVRRLYVSPAVREFCMGCGDGYENVGLAYVVSKMFKVSYESAKIRIQKLDLLYPPVWPTTGWGFPASKPPGILFI